MRRRRTAGRSAAGALLLALALGGFGLPVEAGPLVTHHLADRPASDPGSRAEVDEGSAPVSLPGGPSEAQLGTVRVTLGGMGYPCALPDVTSGEGVACRRLNESADVLPLPTGPIGLVERPLLDEARAARRSIAAADVGEKRPIPEPAASVLLLTGIGTILVGLLARQRLLRHRA